MNLTTHLKKLGTGFLLVILISGCTDKEKPLLQVGKKAPSFILKIDGEKSSLEQYSGKALVITFMSSWCPCSKESIPFMKKAYLQHKKDGISFLMIGIQDTKSKFEKFVGKWEIPFSTGFDAEGNIARSYGVTAPPTTFFIDKNNGSKRFSDYKIYIWPPYPPNYLLRVKTHLHTLNPFLCHAS